MSNGSVAGAILAGGKSRRMGAPKASIPMEGRPLWQWAAMPLVPVANRIIAVTGTSDERFPESAAVAAKIAYTADTHPGAGPLAGVHAALLALEPGEAVLVVVTCDMPFVPVPLIEAMLARVRPDDAPKAAAWADDTGRTQHFPAVIARGALEAVRRRLGDSDRSMRSLLADLSAEIVPIGDISRVGKVARSWASFNVNTPCDLEAAERAARLHPELRSP